MYTDQIFSLLFLEYPSERYYIKTVGAEMLDAHQNGLDQPELVGDHAEDSPVVLAVKKLIREMACFHSDDRIPIQEASRRLFQLKGIRGLYISRVAAVIESISYLSCDPGVETMIRPPVQDG